MAEVSFEREHRFTHAQAGKRIENELRRLAKKGGAKITEDKPEADIRHIEFAGEKFSGKVRITERDAETLVKFSVEYAAPIIGSVGIKNAAIQIKDNWLSATGEVPFLLRGTVRKELDKIVNKALGAYTS